jgi:hypothetical protein
MQKILDHVSKSSGRTGDGDPPVKIVFQATGVQFGNEMDLFILGTNPALGDLDLKQARWMKKMPVGTYHSTIFVNPSTSFIFWYSLIRRARELFSGTALPETVGGDDEPNIVWTSGIGNMYTSSNLSVVVQLMDEWNLLGDPGHEVASNAQATALHLNPKKDVQVEDGIQMRLTCKICWDQESQLVFIPCGHVGTCLTCGSKLLKCPICRSDIRRRNRIFL